MDEKRCSTCHLMRPLSEFSLRRKSKDGRQSRCKSCWCAWYLENRESHIAEVERRKSERQVEHQRRLAEHLGQHPCVDCGESDVRVLDFDHEDPAEKGAGIARLASMHIAWSRIEAEIAKCSVRCANCHRRRTSDMFGYWRSAVEQQRRDDRQALAVGRLQVILGG